MTTHQNKNPVKLSKRYYHASTYRGKRDYSGHVISSRGLYYRDYRCLRVFIQSGLPLHPDDKNSEAYRVLVSRGKIQCTQ